MCVCMCVCVCVCVCVVRVLCDVCVYACVCACVCCTVRCCFVGGAWSVHVITFTCMPTGGAKADRQSLVQLTCSSAGTALQQCTPTHTRSPLPLPAPAEGTQGQVSWYKQLLPSVQGRSKGEALTCVQREELYQFLGKDSGKLQPHHDTITTCTLAHLYTHIHHTHTQLNNTNTCMPANIIHIILNFQLMYNTYNHMHIPCKFPQVCCFPQIL